MDNITINVIDAVDVITINIVEVVDNISVLVTEITSSIQETLVYIKADDEVKSNDNSWKNDWDLVTDNLKSNNFYAIEMVLMTKADPTTDIEFRLVKTDLDDSDLVVSSYYNDGASQTTSTFTELEPQHIINDSVDTLKMSRYLGYIKTGVTTGSLALQWRQKNIGVGNSILCANSTLILKKL